MDQDIRIEKALARLFLCLTAGGILTFLVLAILGHLPLFLVKVLNLPAVIYCAFLSIYEETPEVGRGLYESDRSVYCYFTGLLFNIPYYALVIYAGWWTIEKVARRKMTVVR